MPHTFHIPVLGLGFSVDTPVKVAKYGISSVASIVDDMLVERMREFYAKKRNETFVPIPAKEHDSRAKRITAYLNLINKIVHEEFEALRKQPFEAGSDITRYFELLPDESALKMKYQRMLQTDEKLRLQEELRREMKPGAIDVNIMSKVDKMNFTAKGEALGEEF